MSGHPGIVFLFPWDYQLTINPKTFLHLSPTQYRPSWGTPGIPVGRSPSSPWEGRRTDPDRHGPTGLDPLHTDGPCEYQNSLSQSRHHYRQSAVQDGGYRVIKESAFTLTFVLSVSCELLCVEGLSFSGSSSLGLVRVFAFPLRPLPFL